MDLISWTADGIRIYLEESTVFITYDQLTVYLVILGLGIGLMVGVIVSYFTRINSHRAVKALLFEGCLSPDDAKTVGELNSRRKKQIMQIIKNGKHLSRVIICANIDEMPKKTIGKIWKNKKSVPEEKTVLDFKTARFYIPEEKRIHAEVRYSNEGMSPLSLVITLILIAGVSVAALYLVPDLITMAHNVFDK